MISFNHISLNACARNSRGYALLRRASGYLLFFFITGTALGAVIVDQQFVPNPTSVVQARSEDFNGQSFTVGHWGILKRIEIWVIRDFGVTNDMAWTLFRFNGDFLPFLAEVSVPNGRKTSARN